MTVLEIFQKEIFPPYPLSAKTFIARNFKIIIDFDRKNLTASNCLKLAKIRNVI